MPDLPIPVTMTRPLHWQIRVTACPKRLSTRSTSASTAAASVCRTLRASVRSGMSDDLIKSDEPPQERLDAIQPQRIGGITFGAPGLLVDLHEYAVDAGRDTRLRHRLDVFGKAGRHAVAGAGQLQAVRHVEDDGVAERPQHRKGAWVDHQVVVAERHAALGD